MEGSRGHHAIKIRRDFSAVREVPEAEIYMYAQQTYRYTKTYFTH